MSVDFKKSAKGLLVAEHQDLTPEMLRKLVRYDPETGKLYWRQRSGEMFAAGNQGANSNAERWNARWAGKEALQTISEKGYARGEIFGRQFQAHRVAWAIATGAWPKDEIDHVNGRRADNRLENLREASHSQNARNRRSQAGSSSNYLGVSRRKDRGTWLSAISVNGKVQKLGTFKTEVEAARAYDAKAQEVFGEFARINFPEIKS